MVKPTAFWQVTSSIPAEIRLAQEHIEPIIAVFSSGIHANSVISDNSMSHTGMGFFNRFGPGVGECLRTGAVSGFGLKRKFLLYFKSDPFQLVTW